MAEGDDRLAELLQLERVIPGESLAFIPASDLSDEDVALLERKIGAMRCGDRVITGIVKIERKVKNRPALKLDALMPKAPAWVRSELARLCGGTQKLAKYLQAVDGVWKLDGSLWVKVLAVAKEKREEGATVDVCLGAAIRYADGILRRMKDESGNVEIVDMRSGASRLPDEEVPEDFMD